MEGLNSEKFSSRLNKLGSSKALNETKQKKSKRKKKSRKCSGKSDSGKSDVELQGAKLTSDEERSAPKTSEEKALEGNYHESEDSSSTVGQTVKLPLLVHGAGMSTFNNADSTPGFLKSLTSSTSTIKQSSGVDNPDQVMISSLAQKMSTINMKQKLSSKNSSRSRQSNSVSKQNGRKQSRNNNKDKYVSQSAPLNGMVPSSVEFSSIGPLQSINPSQVFSKSVNPNNESLRWECTLEDSEEERERIQIYKINRRKRYLAAAQAKGLSWAVNCTMSSSFQFCNDKGLESRISVASSYTDYRPVKNLGISKVRGMMGLAIMEC